MPIKLVSYERFGMSTRLETEARSNSAMASLGLKKKTLLTISMLFSSSNVKNLSPFET